MKASTLVQLTYPPISTDYKIGVEFFKVSISDQYGPREFLRGPFDVIDVLAGNDYSDANFNKMVDLAMQIMTAMVTADKERVEASYIIDDKISDLFNNKKHVLVLDSWGPWQKTVSHHPFVLAVIHPAGNGGWMLHLPTDISGTRLSNCMWKEDLGNGLVAITDWMTIWCNKERAIEVAETLLHRFEKIHPNECERLIEIDEHWGGTSDDNDDW